MSGSMNCFRTNYFTVKDEDAFRQWVAAFIECPILIKEASFTDIAVQTGGVQQRNERPLFALSALDSIPNCRLIMEGDADLYNLDEDSDEGILQMDFPRELCRHLSDMETVIIQEIGYENSKYFSGVASVFGSDGKNYGTINISNSVFPNLPLERFHAPLGFEDDVM